MKKNIFKLIILLIMFLLPFHFTASTKANTLDDNVTYMNIYCDGILLDYKAIKFKDDTNENIFCPARLYEEIIYGCTVEWDSDNKSVLFNIKGLPDIKSIEIDNNINYTFIFTVGDENLTVFSSDLSEKDDDNQSTFYFRMKAPFIYNERAYIDHIGLSFWYYEDIIDNNLYINLKPINK